MWKAKISSFQSCTSDRFSMHKAHSFYVFYPAVLGYKPPFCWGEDSLPTTSAGLSLSAVGSLISTKTSIILRSFVSVQNRWFVSWTCNHRIIWFHLWKIREEQSESRAAVLERFDAAPVWATGRGRARRGCFPGAVLWALQNTLGAVLLRAPSHLTARPLCEFTSRG